MVIVSTRRNAILQEEVLTLTIEQISVYQTNTKTCAYSKPDKYPKSAAASCWEQ